MKRSVLFVTDTQGNPDEGLSYALGLAKMIDKGISVLMVEPRRLSESFERVMTAMAFAEAGEQDTARQYMYDAPSPQDEIAEACRRSGISPIIHTSKNETASAIEDYLRQDKGVDMVILSPNITMNGGLGSRALNRLVKTASTPIVTLTRNAQTA